MAIPESQLDTWSHQGSVTQSSDTYNAVKAVLESPLAPYAGKSYDVFLQGSYGNDTNIYAESDVDVVIRLNSTYQYDIGELNDAGKQSFNSGFSNASYFFPDFKRDVISVLTRAYGTDVSVGTKAITVAARGNRRKVDVIAAIQFRRYRQSQTGYVWFDEGICFYTASGQQIVNYPNQHRDNLTTKHKNAAGWFKPMVRVVKNMRNEMTNRNLIVRGSAPSYYLEGLLYNVPASNFGVTYGNSFVESINWINQADRSKFVCANEQYLLLHDSSLMTWRAAQCDAFISGAIRLWNEW